jgi:hypothetical protein
MAMLSRLWFTSINPTWRRFLNGKLSNQPFAPSRRSTSFGRPMALPTASTNRVLQGGQFATAELWPNDQ